MGFFNDVGDFFEGAGKAVINTVEHTVNMTVNGVSQTVKVVTNAAGEAVNDVVDTAGKVIIKAGTKIH